MRRREFIILLGGAAASGPLAARAQQTARPVIGYLSAGSEADSISAPFRKGLGEGGFAEGDNARIDARFAGNDYKRLPELAAELVRRKVDVIYASGGSVAALAAKASTKTVPIVFAIGDNPVGSGLVASLSRPGGNVTGVAFLSGELGPKRLELLHEIVPGAKHYAVLINPDIPNANPIVAGLRAAAQSIGRQVDVFNVRTVGEIDTAFADLVDKGADALVVGGSSLVISRRVQLAILTSHYRIPAIYYDRKVVEVGGLMSYGADIDDAQRQAGIYVARILKGEKPADMPVAQATKFSFVINLETAKTLGLTVPPTLLAAADEVIE
jgi:putative tryptophan/tyrosine transport system substrate-binding protein